MAPSVRLFGPVDGILGAGVIAEVLVIEVLLFVLVLVNFGTRAAAHARHKRQAETGAEAVTRFLPHEATNTLLLLGSLYYMTLDAHAGMVMSVLVLAMFLSDFFEFEARRVEARREIPLERPKGALAAGVFVLMYAAYQTLFFLVDNFVAAVI